MPPDVGVAGGQLVHAQRPGVAWADRRVVVQPDLRSGDRACPGPKCRHMFLEPRRAPALVHHQVSLVLRLVLQRVHRHVWVVRHPRRHQQGGATAPTCTITHSARSCACPVAWVHWSSVVTNHNGVGAWGRGRRGSGHATSALGSWCSLSASTSRRMYMRAAGGWYAAPRVGGG